MTEGEQGRFLHGAFNYLVAVLLVAVAALQLYRAHALDQSPWKGGGFGMFSTADSPGARIIRVYLITPDGEHRVRVPGQLSRLGRITRVVPTEENLDLLAKEISQLDWVEAPYPYPFLSAGENPVVRDDKRLKEHGSDGRRLRVKLESEPEFPAEQVVEYSGVRLELWKMHYDRSGATVSIVLQREVSRERVGP